MPREDPAWFYDNKTCNLILFGGWANRWLGDVWLLNVSPIIGPPYACMGVSPHVGPVFGDTEIQVHGLNFKDGKIEVKFGSGKTEAISMGKWVDEKTITCRTPNFEAFGALPVDLRININGEGWTVNKVTFTYFANPSAKFSLCYGPGVLPTVLAGVEMPFIIQSKDTCNNKRTTGGDEFVVEVISEDGKQKGDVRVIDLDNGTYEVLYTAPTAGKYLVHVGFDELGDPPVVLPIRGSPFKVEIVDPWTYNSIQGTAPPKAKEGKLLALGQELVLYNPADASTVSVGKQEGQQWTFATAPTADKGSGRPANRKLPGTAVLGKDELVVSGGSVSDKEVDDLWLLSKEGESWTWFKMDQLSHVSKRRAAAADAPAPAAEPSIASSISPAPAAEPSSAAAPAAESSSAAAPEGAEAAEGGEAEKPAAPEGAEGGEAEKPAAAEEEKPAEPEAPAAAAPAEAAGGEEEEEVTNKARMQAVVAPIASFAQGAVVDKKILVFGGSRDLTALEELEFFDLAAGGKAVEVTLKGNIPRARKQASAVQDSKTSVFLFGGIGADEVTEEDEMLNDMYRFVMSGKAVTVEVVKATGAVPSARYDAQMVQYDKNRLLLIGGTTRDDNQKDVKLNDVYMFDVEKKHWTLIYKGALELGPSGPMTLFKNQAVGLHVTGSGNTYPTTAVLDFVDKYESQQFLKKMKTEGVAMMDRVGGWIERQATGLDMAANLEALTEDFSRLVKTLEALFNVRARADNIDLEIDQIKEVMLQLKRAKVPNLAKQEKELEDIEARWTEIKKDAPVVRKAVEELQKQEGERIRHEIGDITETAKAFRKDFLSRPFLKYESGYDKAIGELDQDVLPKLKELKDKVTEYGNYANIFEFPELVVPALKELTECEEDAQAARETWGMVKSILAQKEAWAQTPWSQTNTEELDSGARNFVKDKRNLPKRSNDMGVYKGMDLELKNIMTSIPLVSDLRSPAMRERHWKLLMEATQKSFVMDANFKLGDLLALQLHLFEEQGAWLACCSFPSPPACPCPRR